MTTSKKYTVVGPMSKGNELAHVHIKGCRDLNNLRIYRGQTKATVEAESPIKAAFAAVLDRDLGYTEADAKVFPCCDPVKAEAEEAGGLSWGDVGLSTPTGLGTSTGKKSKRAKAKAEAEEAPAKKASPKKAPAPEGTPAKKAPAPGTKRLELTTRQRDLLQIHAINTPTKDEIGAKGKMVTVTAEFVADLEWLAQDKDPITAKVFKGLLARTNAWVLANGLGTL